MEPKNDQADAFSRMFRMVKLSFVTIMGLFTALALIWLLGHFTFIQ